MFASHVSGRRIGPLPGPHLSHFYYYYFKFSGAVVGLFSFFFFYLIIRLLE